MKRPNIVLIQTDQHRRDLIGCYGGAHARTPNVDRLAREGVRFANAYTVSPLCTPARASLQTGLYPCRHGMQNNLYQPGCVVHELPDTPDILPRRLGEAGYSAGFTGKWHLGYGAAAHADPWYRDHVVEGAVDHVRYPAWYRAGSSLPTDLGYEGDDFPGHGAGGHLYQQFHRHLAERGLRFDYRRAGGALKELCSGAESSVDRFLSDRAIDLIDRFRERDRPFCVQLHFWGPHSPYLVPSAFLDPFRELDIPPWPSFDEDLSRKPAIQWAKRDAEPWAHFRDHVRWSLAYGHFIDHEIGRVLAHLEAHGLYDDSLIVFTADHGDSLGMHGGMADKAFSFYEETAGIPLVVKLPGGGRAGAVEERFANTTDLYATLIDAAGLDVATNHGRSLLPLCRGEPPADWPDHVLSECSGLAYLPFAQRMVRRGNWKYVFNAGDLDELYDLAADPHELDNRIDDPACRDERESLRDLLDQDLARLGDRLRGPYRMLRRAPR